MIFLLLWKVKKNIKILTNGLSDSHERNFKEGERSGFTNRTRTLSARLVTPKSVSNGEGTISGYALRTLWLQEEEVSVEG